MITVSASPFIKTQALHQNSDTKQSVKSRRTALQTTKLFPPGHLKREEAYHIYREKRNACRQIVRDALGQVLDDAVNQGKYLEIAALDLAKACNRTWTPRVLNQLANWGDRT